MIILCIFLLPKDKVPSIPTESGKTTKPTPIINRVIEVDVSPMITIESIDLNNF